VGCAHLQIGWIQSTKERSQKKRKNESKITVNLRFRKYSLRERLAHRQECKPHNAREVKTSIHFSIRTRYPIPPALQYRMYLKPTGKFILHVIKFLVLIIKIILKKELLLKNKKPTRCHLLYIFIITNTMHTIGVDKITLFKTT
jgi:hypothetical protein